MKKHEVIVYEEKGIVRTNALVLIGAKRDSLPATLKLSFWRRVWNFIQWLMSTVR